MGRFKNIYKTIFTLLFVVMLVSCQFLNDRAGNYLRNKRINYLLESKTEDYKVKYRSIAWFRKEKDKVVLIYNLKPTVTLREFRFNPCTILKNEFLKLQGEGFAVFNNAIGMTSWHLL